MQMRTRAKVSKTRVHDFDFTPLAYEAEIVKSRDYLLHLPNGETVCLSYDEDHGPVLSVTMWPGENKTFINVRNQHVYQNAEDMR
jgi:hypothetical protein